MNELLEIAKLLADEFVSEPNKWQVLKAEKIGHCENEPDGWVLTIKKMEKESEGAKNDNNEQA